MLTYRIFSLDLKMENVGMQGFENDRPNENIRNLIVRLSDCGASKETLLLLVSLHV